MKIVIKVNNKWREDIDLIVEALTHEHKGEFDKITIVKSIKDIQHKDIKRSKRKS
jgi:hypothetical protein